MPPFPVPFFTVVTAVCRIAMASPLAEMGQIPQAGATVQNTYSTRTLMGNWREEKFDDDLEKKKKRAIRALNPPGEHWQTTYGGTIGSPMPQPARKAPFRPTRPSLGVSRACRAITFSQSPCFGCLIGACSVQGQAKHVREAASEFSPLLWQSAADWTVGSYVASHM